MALMFSVQHETTVGVGGINAGILPMIMTAKPTLIGKHLRLFRRTILTEQERGRKCGRQIDLVNQFRDTTNHLLPLTHDLLRDDCEFCRQEDHNLDP